MIAKRMEDIKVGMVVTVNYTGHQYTSYREWIQKRAPQYEAAYMSRNTNDVPTLTPLQVLVIAPHTDRDHTLMLVRDNRNGNLFLYGIDAEGYKCVDIISGSENKAIDEVVEV